MSMYYEGYTEARGAVNDMNEAELLDYVASLWPDEVGDYDGVEELRVIALEQCRREFTNTSSKQYEMAQFWTGVIRAQHSQGRGR